MTSRHLPLVTIMIPTYNQAATLPRAIRSAQLQTYQNLEILVSDDNSKDNTSEVVQAFQNDSRVKYFKHTQNLGRVSNYRKMIYELATGEWLLNVDGDDFLTDPTFIENAISIAQKKPELVLIFARQKYLNKTLNQDTVHPAPQLPSEMSGLELFLLYPSIPEGMPHIGSLYKREVALKSNVQSEDIITSDSESLLRIIVHGQVAYLNQIVGCWVEHQSNESGKLDFAKRWSSLRMALGPAEYLKNLKLTSEQNVENWKNQMLTRLIRENLCLYLDRQDHSGFAQFFKMSLKEFPKSAFSAALSKSVLARFLVPGFSKLKPIIKNRIRSTNAEH